MYVSLYETVFHSSSLLRVSPQPPLLPLHLYGRAWWSEVTSIWHPLLWIPEPGRLQKSPPPNLQHSRIWPAGCQVSCKPTVIVVGFSIYWPDIMCSVNSAVELSCEVHTIADTVFNLDFFYEIAFEDVSIRLWDSWCRDILPSALLCLQSEIEYLIYSFPPFIMLSQCQHPTSVRLRPVHLLRECLRLRWFYLACAAWAPIQPIAESWQCRNLRPSRTMCSN